MNGTFYRVPLEFQGRRSVTCISPCTSPKTYWSYEKSGCNAHSICSRLCISTYQSSNFNSIWRWIDRFVGHRRWYKDSGMSPYKFIEYCQSKIEYNFRISKRKMSFSPLIYQNQRIQLPLVEVIELFGYGINVQTNV